MRSIRRIEAAVVTAAVCLIPLFAGCSSNDHKAAAPVASSDQPAAPALPSPAQVHANEAGDIPVLGFGDIVAGSSASGGKITATEFKKDLDWLYAHDYRPVNLTDVVSGKVDCPAGKKPVVLAFDRGTPGQYDIQTDGNTNPNCALSILEAMNNDHPDWPLRGVFLIDAQNAIDKKAFGSASTSDYKLEHLGGDGFDLGCALPSNFAAMSPDADRKLLALSVSALQIAGKGSSTCPLYVPSGQYPKDPDLLKAGSTQMTRFVPMGGIPTRGRPPKPQTTSYAQKYNTSCALTDGDKASVTPVSPKFNGYHIPEMHVAAGHSVEELLKAVKNPFVSDGDPSTIAVPSDKKGDVDAQLIQQDNLQLKTY